MCTHISAGVAYRNNQGFDPRDSSRTHMIESQLLYIGLPKTKRKPFKFLVHLQGFEPGTH